MRLIIRDSPSATSAYVANYIITRIKAFSPTSSRPFILGLPTGSSPLGVYRILVEEYKAGEISFANVITFNMDEYISLPRDHPQSYHTFMYQHLFSHIDIPPQNVHIPNGNAPCLETECAAFEAKIASYGGIDLFLCGLGSDGHIAFNEPGSSLSSRTRVKTLAYDTVLANARFFGGDVNAVPRMSVSVGVGTVLEAREVVMVVLGAEKAPALQKCVEEGVNHMWTGSALQMHRFSMVVCDEDATAELRVKTVKYFKSIEKVAREQGFEQGLPVGMRGVSTPGMLVTGEGEVNGEEADGEKQTSEWPTTPSAFAANSASSLPPSKKIAVSPGLPRPPVPSWDATVSRKFTNPPKPSPPTSSIPRTAATLPISLSLSEDERSPNRSSASGDGMQSPQFMGMKAIGGQTATGQNPNGSPLESADLLYEYFPLSLDDWMPPVDAVYRPHVVHHTIVPPEVKAQQTRSKTKRYFAAE